MAKANIRGHILGELWGLAASRLPAGWKGSSGSGPVQRQPRCHPTADSGPGCSLMLSAGHRQRELKAVLDPLSLAGGRALADTRVQEPGPGPPTAPVTR